MELGASPAEIVRLFRSFNGYSDAFRAASDKFEEMLDQPLGDDNKPKKP